MNLSRRNWLAIALTPAIPAWALPKRDFSFQHDYILGTSFDLSVLGATASEARAAEQAALAEVQRLNGILNTRDPHSEINRPGYGITRSKDLDRVLAAYAYWESATGGVLRERVAGRANVDALGKAYIVDRAAEAARVAAPNAQALILDIGGDIRVFGEVRLGIADPANPAENALPLTHVRLTNGAIATSGTYARGAHILDPRTGLTAQGARAASVTAPDCVTANALSLALCVLSPTEGISLLDASPEAEGLLVTSQGGVLRSAGFRRFEEPRSRSVAYAGWPNGYQVSVSFTLKDPEPQSAPNGGGFGGKGGGFGGRGGAFGRLRRPYVAVWAEDANGKVVNNLSLWANKQRYYPELRTWWRKNGGSMQLADRIARATRDAGQYTLTWNGQTDSGQPVPPGIYKIWIETNREHGSHYEASASIDCSDKPSTAEMKDMPEFFGSQGRIRTRGGNSLSVVAGILSQPPSVPARPHPGRLKREAIKWARTIHIYLSLSAFVMFLFFAVTGIMLTHDSFGLDQVTDTSQTGQIPATVAQAADQAAVLKATQDAFHIRLPLTQFNVTDDEIEVTFAGPSRRVQAFVKRSTGATDVTFETRGVVGMLADLHKGAETGWAWRILLDVVSVWIALSSITGMIMLLALPKRRALGLAITVLGGLITLAAYALYVPRQ